MTSPDTRAAAIRLVFEYEDGNVRLVSQVPVSMVPPRSVNDDRQSLGEYVEVRTPEDDTVGRARVHPRISSSLEVFPEDHADPIVRTDLPQPRGAFTVVVPALPSADHVVVLQVRPNVAPAPGGVLSEAAAASTFEEVELGSFRLERRPR